MQKFLYNSYSSYYLINLYCKISLNEPNEIINHYGEMFKFPDMHINYLGFS